MAARRFNVIVLLMLMLSFYAFAGPLDDLPDFVPDATMSRSDIPAIYKWNLKDLCASDEDWAAEMVACRKELEGFDAYHAGLRTPKGLAAYMDVYFKLDDRVNRLTLYANLKKDSETTNQQFIADHELALHLTEDIMQEGAVLRQAILEQTDESLKKALKEEPALDYFMPYIESLRRRADRLLSPAEERLLSLAGDNLWAQIDLNELPAAPEKVFRAFIADMPLPMFEGPEGKEVQLTFSNFGRFRNSPDRNVRRGAVAAMFKILKNYENTLATTLSEQAKFSLFLSKARGYDTVLEAYLDKDALSPEVYMNLIHTVRANVNYLHNYVDLRKKALRLDDVHLYDLYVPLVEESPIVMDYKKGVEYILAALKPMGKEYTETLAGGLNPAGGWIDIYPSKNKDSGAFSAATYGIHPYVKMNFQNTFNDVSTLAHEYGHALHSHYAMATQSYLAWRYSPFLAEIASTCNEVLLSRYMIAHASSDKEKAWLLSELLETIRTTIYRQTLFAEFELKLHRMAEAGEPINAAKLNGIYEDLVRTYYGPGYAIDENDHIEWAYIPHFYYKYYVFTYATGLSSGIAFADKILKEGQPARSAYLGMLKGGSSKPPLVLLKEAGLDLTKPEAIQAALSVFNETLGELEVLLDK